MADLTTLDNAKAYLGLDAGQSADDALLSRLISAASKFLTKQIDRTLASTAYTMTFDGDGDAWVLLREYPVVSVASVTVDGVTVPQRTTVTGEGWLLDGDRVRLVGYTFARGVQNCTIAYTAGYSTTPEDVEQAVIELVAYRYKSKDRTGIMSKTLVSNESVMFSGYSNSTASVDAVIEQYRRPGVA